MATIEKKEKHVDMTSPAAFSQIGDLRTFFDLLDKNKDGSLNEDELSQSIRSMGLGFSQNEIHDMIKEFDFSGKGCISFTDFVSGFGFQMKGMDPEGDLRDAFRIIDNKRMGFISCSDFERLMCDHGDSLSKEEFTALIRDMKLTAGSPLEYEAFLRLLYPK